ncbi:hypothetical protein RFI_24126, partial [Reticulomyxa filosa]
LEQVLLVTKKWRPEEKPKENAKGWWQYCAQSIINLQRKAKNVSAKVKENPLVAVFAYSFQRTKRRYIELYQRKMRPSQHDNWMPQLDNEEAQELQDLEDRMAIDQILIFRCFAMAELREALKKREVIQQAKQKEKEERMKESSKLTKWLSYAQSYLLVEEEFGSDYQLTGEEKQKMLSQMNMTESMSRLILPHYLIQHQVILHLNKASLNLTDHNHAIIATFQLSVPLRSAVGSGVESSADIATESELIRTEVEVNPPTGDAFVRVLVHVQDIQSVWNINWVKDMVAFLRIAKPVFTDSGVV